MNVEEFNNLSLIHIYLFPFGWGELWGIADRTDYDLKKHAEHSGTDMSYLDPTTNEK